MTSEMTLGTPALLFPAVSLLLLAYTNRFLGLASVVRGLHARYKQSGERALLGQIHNIRQRLALIRSMQAAGVLSLLVCVICMFALFAGYHRLAHGLFGLSLITMMISLAISVREIQISTVALSIQLGDLEADLREPSGWTSPTKESKIPTAP